MPEKREHAWVQLPEVDQCRCELCGAVASNTAIGSQWGLKANHGFAYAHPDRPTEYIPPCVDVDLDRELAKLLADAGPDP